MQKFVLAFAMLAATAAAPASAAVIIDQIAPTPNGSAAQYFEAAFNAFDSGIIDDFTISGTASLTSITAQFQSNNLGGATSFAVQFYTSQAAALSSLTGNAGSFNFAPGSVSLTGAGSTVTIGLSNSLAAGTYWVAVIPTLNFGSFGQSFMGHHGTGNAMLVNPGGGFGLPNGAPNIGNAAFRLEGDVAAVPEPASWALLVAGFGLTGAAMRRRKASVTA